MMSSFHARLKRFFKCEWHQFSLMLLFWGHLLVVPILLSIYTLYMRFWLFIKVFKYKIKIFNILKNCSKPEASNLCLVFVWSILFFFFNSLFKITWFWVSIDTLKGSQIWFQRSDFYYLRGQCQIKFILLNNNVTT